MKRKINCIMLIDDNDEDNYFHKIILNELQICNHIQVAESGFEALEYLKKGNPIPDLIFLDINMPKMNGWEFLKEYSKINKHLESNIIIIMITTSLNPADRSRSDNIDLIDGFESKPLTEEMVNEIVKKHFE